jgi:hypothetical protein
LILLAGLSKLVIDNLQFFFTTIFFMLIMFAMISYCNSQEHKCVINYQEVMSNSIGFVVSNITEK